MSSLIKNMLEAEASQAPDFKTCANSLGTKIPLLYELEHTEQDPGWHAEGNVAIHTQMVMNELEALLLTTPLKPDTQQALRLAALLHDIAKPYTTKRLQKDGIERIVAPRHAERGASYLAYRLYGLGLPFKTYLNILNLVRYHHNPKQMVIKDAPEGVYRKLARKISPQMLYWLELADMRGRICDDQDDQVTYIELFKMGCEEASIWSENDLFYNDFVRKIADASYFLNKPFYQLERAIQEGLWDFEAGRIYTPEEAVSKAYAVRDHNSQLWITCGPSGSGKSTWVKTHAKDMRIISMDELRGEVTGKIFSQKQNGRVLALAKERLKEALRAGQNVVWEATGLRRDFRKMVCDLGCDYGAHITLVIFVAQVEDFYKRNRDRDRSVPDHILDRQLKGMQWPDSDEAHRIIYVNEKGEIIFDSRKELQDNFELNESKI